jgi:tetratricopeptide (TPR) repeat protein
MNLRVILVLLLAAAVVACGWIGYSVYENRRFEAERAQARADVRAERFLIAKRRLDQLVKARANDGESLVLLGLCEQNAGRFEAALSAWLRVEKNDAWKPEAARLAADELINSGRYGAASEQIQSALQATQDTMQRYALLKVLTRVARFEGLTQVVRAGLRQAIPISPDPASDLKELWMLDNSPTPVEAQARALRGANQDDGGVWLGRVNVAILSGDLDEARQGLDKARGFYSAAHPGVARTEFNLAFAKLDPSELATVINSGALEWLDGDEMSLVAARLLDNLGSEQEASAALHRLLGHHSAQSWALDRLAERAATQGDFEAARRFQAEKSVLDAAKDRFRDILLDGPPADHYEELSKLAEQLGRPAEAKAWRILAAGGKAATLAGVFDQLPTGEWGSGRDGKLSALREVLAGLSTKSEGNEPSGRTPTPPVFSDRAGSGGLDFRFDNGATANRLLPETMSGGVGLLDFDADGTLDVFLVQGGSLFDSPGEVRESDRLFRNLGAGKFEDVTERSGISSFPRGYGMGVAVADYDNDGFPDLFLSRLQSYALWRNRGDGTFEDVTESAGLAGVRDYPSSAAFADLDDDGDLDLYVCHYMVFDPENPVICRDEHGKPLYCDPSKVQAAPDHLFRNDNGRFVDITAESGIVDPNGRGLGVVAADLDEDGRVDLYVANDGTANYLFRNLGALQFEDVALSSGVAGNAEGGYQASMGVACGDLDGDGRLDLLVTNFWGECSTLYRNLGNGMFADWTASSGLGVATRYLLGFGTSFFDYDNDGALDLVTANGHVNDGRPFTPYAMRPQLLGNRGAGRLIDVGLPERGVWEREVLGRGLAVGDFDNDGRPDVVIVPQADALLLLHNETAAGNFVALKLVGRKSNRDAVGARVVVKHGDHTQTFVHHGGGSYQSSSDPRFLIGLGSSSMVDSLEITWPSGLKQQLTGLPVNTGLMLVEGDEQAATLPGFEPVRK